ncbi:aldehyde dehydrogenase family protein [Streptomyces fuscigenes]|uniref:aldehyde dehydrogenase family protein n=1 Tax=Streptomyces fuscigenes TaxID=1528880 RepID=UPI001F3E3BAE|nr:aldehyde dehydrogenase family protein [Streptomyces fuscigenes]MCF3963009.1 aldehyde dehydrogenase family protein [Streptomyces fuscigenes]
MKAHDAMYIGGQWRPAAAADTIAVVNPADERIIAEVPAGTAPDVDAAVGAAREALPGWAATPPAARAAFLGALHDAMARRGEEIARTVVAELGAPARFARQVQTRAPIAALAAYAELAAAHPFEERIANSTVLHEPVGVVAAITPWNYPVSMIVGKVAPALAAGCTLVLKPAEDTPLSAQLFGECAQAAGLPPGVVNVVTGHGRVAGEALARHEGVDHVSFTGSTSVGRHIGALAGGAVKSVSLELGGKSANVILPGADLGRAVAAGVGHVMANSGQTCYAWTRMLVHAAHYEEAVELARRELGAYRVGDPAADGTRVGPVVSARQRDRVRGYIARGVEEGARLVAGGTEPPRPTGYFVAPTLFADVTTDMTIAQEEIFGPVLSVLRYEDEEDAVRIANDTVYGLHGGVWASTEKEAVAFARRMDTGRVDINGGAFNTLAPFGGWKQSGVGREMGTYGLRAYLQTKSLQL